MMIKKVGVDGTVYVPLFRGFVDLDKFVADIGWVKGF